MADRFAFSSQINNFFARLLGRSGKNVVWSGIDFAAVPVGMLIATPILIYHLGLEQFGVLVLVNALVGFSAVFNFGFGDTTLKYVSHYMKLDDQKNAAQIVGTIGLMALGAGVLIAGVVVSLTPTLVGILNIGSLPYAESTLLAAALIMPCKMMESVYISTLRGCYRYELAGYVTAPLKVGNIVSQATLAVLGFNLPIILLATAGIAATSVILLFGVSWKNLGNIFPSFHRRAFDDVRHFAGWSWVQGLAGMIYANIDRLMISALLGPAALGIYGVCIQLAQQIHLGLAALAHTLFPRISMIGSEVSAADSEKGVELRDIYITASRMLTVIAVLAGSLLALFSYPILEVWVGEDIAKQGDFPLKLLAISFAWFAANSITTYYAMNGLGRARFQAGVSVTGAGLMLASCLVLIPAFGLAGASAARMPDTLFRTGIRMHLGSAIIGGIKRWFSLDFLRVTFLALAAGYPFKILLEMLFGTDRLLANPGAILALLVFAVAMFSLLLKIEQVFSRLATKEARSTLGDAA